MFEGAVAGILNRILGKYVQDLDTENLNVGIFSGNVNLTDLKLKPEALYELDLPIDVKIGTIGRISFQIPWTALYSQPIVIHIDDVLVLVGPAISNSYFDPEREKRLMRAAKRKILQDLEEESEILKGPQNFFENLFTAVVNNLQIYVRNVHVRYEDSISSKDGPLACGLCLQSLSIETTNSKWKPSVTSVNASTVYQMMRIESLSLYWNPTATVLDDAEIANITPMQYYNWKHYMLTGLDKFSMHHEEFEFLLKPVTCKVKLLMSRSAEARVPRLLVDAVIQDSALHLSRRQTLSIDNLLSSLHRVTVNRKYRHLHPGVPLSTDVKKWWIYAYNVVVEQRVRPYTWAAIQKHRKNYNVYKKIYKSTLNSPNDTELKLDLQKCEDSLPIISVVIAREQAKFELLSEASTRIQVVESEPEWWKPSSESTTEPIDSRVLLCVKTERCRSIWSHLSSPEKKRVCELIGYVEGETKKDKSKQYIEHKLNLTLANCSVTLMNRNKEILVVTLTQFLASLETRPSAKAYKLSARTESIVIEGISSDGELVPMVTVERGAHTNLNLIAIDIEKNPINSDADYAFTWLMEPIEVLYVEHAITELINLFQTRTFTAESVLEEINLQSVTNSKLLRNIVSDRRVLQLNVDIKAPCVLIPEYGCMHKSGRVLILDISKITIKSDLQPSKLVLEDATCMELEERLYDRLHAECSVQILFSEWKDRWRELRRHGDSELHVIPRLKAQLVFSNSVKKDYKLLPRYKLNISLSSLRVNISDRILANLLEFLDNLPLPVPNTVPVSLLDSGDYCEEYEDPELVEVLALDKVEPEPGYKDLVALKRKIVAACLKKNRSPQILDKALAKSGFQCADPVFVSSDHSEEDMELYARNVDLPGFDDNVSASNTINTLLRFVVGEVVINLARSTEQDDHPYLMLSVTKICLDVALMEYGPALQFSVGEALLTDKQHHTSDGQYLELLTTSGELLNVIYRKVRADCPEFRSQFHSVERALVADLGHAGVVLHADSLTHLKRLPAMLQNRRTVNLTKSSLHYSKLLWEYLTQTDSDPPVPSGATKFSYSVRAHQISIRLCHSDSSLIQLRLTTLESDCVFRANDRIVFRMALTALNVDDLSETTLYPKLVWPDEDKVLEVKWSKRSSTSEAGGRGELRVRVGRVHVAVLAAVVVRLQQFVEPLIPSTAISSALITADKTIEYCHDALRNGDVRLNLVITLHAPVLLIPQKPSSPSLLVFNMGDLTIENYFKKLTLSHDASSPVHCPVMDNILMKWDNITLCRAVMTLARTLELQEPILEPISIRCDIKRCVCYRQLSSLPSNSQLLLLEADASAETVVINVGQRDIATIAAVLSDNCIVPCVFALGGMVNSPVDGSQTDATINKLQQFFAQGEPVKKEVVFRFSLDGVKLTLFTDMDEVLSSPVRDASHALAGLSLGEGNLLMDGYSDGSVEMRASLQSLLLEDVRNDPSIMIKRIFQSQGGSRGANPTNLIAVSRAPFIELSLRSTKTNSQVVRAHNVNVRLDRARFNVATGFLVQLATTLLDHHPGDRTLEGGLVNPGYVGDVNASKGKRKARAHSSSDSTSGYYSQATSLPEESSSLSISIQFCQPEIMFFTDLTKTEGHALLLRTELLIDYSSHSNTENLVITLAGLQILSKLQSKLTNLPPQMVLKPCDVEYSKSLKNVEEGLKVNLGVSEIEVHLAPTTVHTVMDIIEEVTNELTMPDEKEPFIFTSFPIKCEKEDDLWSPKKLSPFMSMFPCEDSYMLNKCNSFNEKFTVKLPRMRVLFEIEKAVRVPVCVVELSAELSIRDISSSPNGSGSLTLTSHTYNDRLRVCEPLIEPSPWIINIDIVQGKSHPMSSRLETIVKPESETDGSLASERSKKSKKAGFESETSADEAESDCETMFIKNPYMKGNRGYSMEYNGTAFLSALELDNSDSDNEGRLMDKLTTAIGHLFNDDSGSSELSNDEDSSEHEASDVEQSETEDKPVSADVEKRKMEPKTVTLQEPYHEETSSDSETTLALSCTYWLLHSRDPLNITIGRGTVNALGSWIDGVKVRVPVVAMMIKRGTQLVNDIGPGSTVHLRTRLETDLAGNDRVIAVADYDTDFSRPSTPGSATELLEDAIKETKPEPTDIAEEWDCFEGGFGSSAGQVFEKVLTPPGEPSVNMCDETLAIKMHDFDDLLVPCPQRSISKLHVLHPSKNNTRYYVLVERTSMFDASTIVVRSPLQVRNETSYTLELFYKKSDLQSIGEPLIGSLSNPFDDKLRLSVIAPHDTYNVPLYIAYHCKLYLMPNNYEKYQSASSCIWWVDISKELGVPRDLTCSAVDDSGKVFALRIVTVDGCKSHKITRSIPNYLLRVVPPLAIYNRLPYAINITMNSINTRVEAGDRVNLYSVELAQVNKVGVELYYMGAVWNNTASFTQELTEKTINLTCESEGGSHISVRMKIERNDTCNMYLYAPYIVINKTGLPMQIKCSGSEQVQDVQEEPLILTCAQAATRMRLRVQGSSWSRRARLLAAAPGLLACTHRERRAVYRLLLTVTLSELCPQLTKIVTILPYFLVYNDTKRHLRYMEENEAADLWFDLAPQQCAPFWPQTESMMMHCKYRDSGIVSQHFPITKTHFTVLRMDKGSAVCVEVAGGTDRPFTVTFKPFTSTACVRIDNLCDDLFLKLHQEECGQVALLSPYQSLLYTWDDPARERVLLWNIYNNKGKGFVAGINQDGFGEEKVSFHSVKNSTLVAANSVTSKLSSTLKRLTPKSPEPCSSSTDDSDSCDLADTYVKTKKMRKDKVVVYWISYMDDHQRVFALAQDERIAYLYKTKINSERSNYEICVSLPSVGLSICVDNNNITKELAYVSVTDSLPRWEVNVSKKWKQLSPELTSWIEDKYQTDQKKCQLREYIDIDLEKMQMTKPFFSELRRTYNPGVWLQIRKSETSTYYHLKLQSLQIDNQLNDAIFPSVLYPAPLPPDLRSKRPQKPSVELLALKQFRPHLNQEVYKYFKVLIQEYNVNLDRGFINHVFNILNHWKTEEKPAVRLRADLALVHMPLPVIAMKTQTNAQKNVLFEFVHLSPIKLILSLSSRGYTDVHSPGRFGNRENRPKIFNSDLLEYLFNTWGSSLCDMKDVVIRMSFIEFHNAPITAATLIDQSSRHYWMQLIQQYYVLVLGVNVLGNPYSYIGDFTKELKCYYEPYLGVISAVVNNYAESLFSRPKVDTLLTKCKRKIAEEISDDLPPSVLEADKASPASVALALTGLIARPTFDICREAAKAVLSRHSIEGTGAWRRALEGRVVTRRRLPRYCSPVQGIQPFSYHSALGVQLVNVTSRDTNDLYIAHAHLNHNHLILVTTGHIFVVRGRCAGGAWAAEWGARVDDVIPPPLVYQDKLVLNVKQDEEINYFATDEKIIEIKDPELLTWIKSRIEYALMLAQEDKRLPTDVIIQ